MKALFRWIDKKTFTGIDTFNSTGIKRGEARMAKDWKEYERTVAKVLGAWWGCTFRRTPSSGAWSTQGFRMGHGSHTEFHGDIVAPPEARFPFSVECKCYRLVEFYTHFTGKSNIHDWWSQTVNDATRVHKWPLLVMRQNNAKPLVVMSAKLWNAMDFDEPAHPITFMSWMEGKILRQVVVMPLSTFVAIMPVSKLKGKK